MGKMVWWRQYRLTPMVWAGALIFAGVLSLSSLPVAAQDVGPLLDRLDRLERDIRTLNLQISRGGGKTGSGEGGAKPGLVSGSSIADPGLSRMTERIDNLEQDLRGATGTMEELGHGVFQLKERIDKLVSDVDYRLGVLESRAGIGAAPKSGAATAEAGEPAGAATPQSVPPATAVEKQALGQAGAPAGAQPPGSLGTVSARAVDALKADRAKVGVQAEGLKQAAKPPAGKPQSWSLNQQAPTAAKTTPQPASPTVASTAAGSALPAGTVKERYTHALNLLRQTNYDQAEIALKEFVTAHGKSPLAGNARYWLGETYYVRADYEQAAQAFFAGYQAKPEGAKAPDMLLKLGMSLSQLKKQTEACATFSKLTSDFPGATARIKSAVARERKRAGCS